jgi:hypothetical protein
VVDAGNGIVVSRNEVIGVNWTPDSVKVIKGEMSAPLGLPA